MTATLTEGRKVCYVAERWAHGIDRDTRVHPRHTEGFTPNARMELVHLGDDEATARAIFTDERRQPALMLTEAPDGTFAVWSFISHRA